MGWDGREMEMEMEWIALHCMRWLWHVEIYCFRNLCDWDFSSEMGG